MQLDDLVLHKCADKLHFIERIYFESVSYHFANVLKTSNRHQKIWLSIEPEANIKSLLNSDKDIFLLLLRPQRRYNRDNCSAKQKGDFRLHKVEIKKQLEQIFLRFNQFNCLKLSATSSEFIKDTILEVIKCYPPTKLRRLVFVLDRAGDFHCGTIDCRVLEAVSHLLKELAIRCPAPATNESSFKLWTTVATCGNLRSLEYYPLHSEPDQAPSHVQSCLQNLNIRHFYYCASRKTEDVSWLANTFKSNSKLRTLFVNGSDNLASAPELHSLILRLRSVNLNVFEFRGPRTEVDGDETFKVFCALPYRKVEHLTAITREYHYGRVSLPAKTAAEIKEALQLWLKISHGLNKRVNLYVKINSSMQKEIMEKAFEELKSTEQFSLTVIKWTSENICAVQWQNSQLIVRINFDEKTEPFA